MELKPNSSCHRLARLKVLIVLYGIETHQLAGSRSAGPVLIVLYGIETSFTLYRDMAVSVLIVLYGIETREITLVCRQRRHGLNRTLWN